MRDPRLMKRNLLLMGGARLSPATVLRGFLRYEILFY
jgi:hypothetical protein